MSGVGRSVLSFLWFLVPAAPKVFKTCDVASEILQMTVEIAGINESVNCSPADVARIVCIASLHDFNTSYSFKMDNNETASGMFGIPSKFTKNCVNRGKSEKFQDHFDCLTRSQFKRNSKNRTQPFISEVLCNEPELRVKDYFRIFEVWNISDTWRNKSRWLYNRKTRCKDLDLDYLYVTNEDLRRIYRPGELNGATASNETEDYVELIDKPCREMSYCMNSCKGSVDDPKNPGYRKHKGKMERKVERFGRIVDRAIIVIWLIAVGAALVAGYIFVRNPRRRGVRHDDWSRPILTAHFSE